MSEHFQWLTMSTGNGGGEGGNSGRVGRRNGGEGGIVGGWGKEVGIIGSDSPLGGTFFRDVLGSGCISGRLYQTGGCMKWLH